MAFVPKNYKQLLCLIVGVTENTENLATQSTVPRPSALPGSVLEMQDLGFHPDLLEQNYILMRCPSDLYAPVRKTTPPLFS